MVYHHFFFKKIAHVAIKSRSVRISGLSLGPRPAKTGVTLAMGQRRNSPESNTQSTVRRARKGNRWLRGMLTPSAWAATRKGNSYFKNVMLALQPGEAQSELSLPSLASCSLLLTMSLIKLFLIMTWGQNISMSALGIDRSDIIIRRLGELGITSPSGQLHRAPSIPTTR
jgi:hypothetical protein